MKSLLHTPRTLSGNGRDLSGSHTLRGTKYHAPAPTMTRPVGEMRKLAKQHSIRSMSRKESKRKIRLAGLTKQGLDRRGKEKCGGKAEQTAGESHSPVGRYSNPHNGGCRIQEPSPPSSSIPVVSLEGHEGSPRQTLGTLFGFGIPTSFFFFISYFYLFITSPDVAGSYPTTPNLLVLGRAQSSNHQFH